MPTNNENATRSLLMSMWMSWTITVVAFIAVLLLRIIVTPAWLPLPVALLSYTLLVYTRRLSFGATHRCAMISRYGAQVLFWTAVIMETINILNSHMLLDGIIDWSASNRDIPYITSLVLMPVMVFVAAFDLLLGDRSRFCRDCRARNGHVAGNNVVSMIYEKEATYQLQLMLLVSLAIGSIQWWYYFTYYINVSLNSPDRFFFTIMPVILLLVTVAFMLMRYTNMSMMIGPMTQGTASEMSVVRYLVMAGDCMLLTQNSDGRWDTPASADVSPTEFISPEDAAVNFKAVSGINDARMRFLYANKSHDMATEIIHYAAFLKGEAYDAACGNLQGEWCTLDMVDRLLKESALTAELANEIYRIYTITMAWKTYTREGMRRYPIKHYRPTFRLRDFADWDVDYNDISWLGVAHNNEDRPFFRTRRLWQRITGQVYR